jgi:hypothetical protein
MVILNSDKTVDAQGIGWYDVTMEHREHSEQCAVIDWARASEGREPRLGLLYAIPNGASLPYKHSKSGARYSPEAIRLKSEGLLPGIPDLCIPVSCHGYHSLYIEMKAEGGALTDNQKIVIELLREQGHLVEVCYGAESAIRVLENYLDMDSQTKFL